MRWLGVSVQWQIFRGICPMLSPISNRSYEEPLLIRRISECTYRILTFLVEANIILVGPNVHIISS